jgi:hypothetical protein
MSTPTWKLPNQSNDWIGDKLIEQTDDQLLELAKARSREISGELPEQAPQPPAAEDIPVDPVAEQTAFANLLKFIADNPEDDCEFTALSLDEFAAESFTPPTEPEEPMP